MIGVRSDRVAFGIVLAVLASSGLSPPVAAVEFGELFTTPGQRAAARFEAGEFEALVDEAPDALWEGVGRYATGDAVGAADAFARALESGESARTLSPAERGTLLYNRAVAETRAGRLDEAIAGFDELLDRDPEHADARHNRDMARALKALERGRSSEGQDGAESPGGDENGEDGSGEQGEQGEQGGQGSESTRDPASESDERSDGGDGSRQDPDEPGGDDPTRDGDGRDAENAGGASSASDDAADASDAGEADSSDEAAAARAAAEAALEAERRRAGQTATGRELADGDGVGGETEAEVGRADDAVTRTPSEREQATEQWLRRIDDDPSGLLRRRLERSHREDYPEVGDGDEPW